MTIRSTLALSCLLLAGCEASGVDLAVDLRTDLVPGLEVARVQTFVDGARVSDVLATGDYLSGARVAEASGLAPSATRLVRVVLADDAGATVAERSALVDNSNARVVTLVITRACRGVTCADPQTCVDGTCRDRSCLEGTEASCGTAECAADGECMEGVACARASCREGVCLYAPGTCGPDEYCDLDDGCLVESPSDAGVRDAGIDAGVDAGVDAGMDAGVDAGVDAGMDAGVDAGLDAAVGPDAWTMPGSCDGCGGFCTCTAADDTCCLTCIPGQVCDGSCDRARCDVQWMGATNSTLLCDRSSCVVNLRGSVSSDVICDEGDCEVDCTAATSCAVSCIDGAECELLCTGAISCGFDFCEHGMVQDCGGGRRICSAGGC